MQIEISGEHSVSEAELTKKIKELHDKDKSITTQEVVFEIDGRKISGKYHRIGDKIFFAVVQSIVIEALEAVVEFVEEKLEKVKAKRRAKKAASSSKKKK